MQAKALTTCQINRVLKRHLQEHVTFKGVRSAENWPEVPTQNSPQLPMCFVTNTHCQHYSGEHWVAVYVDKFGHGHYFDSYAMRPPHSTWQRWLNRLPRGVSYFPKGIQELDTFVCGHFCIYYLLHRCHPKTEGESDMSIMRNVNGRRAYRYVKPLL